MEKTTPNICSSLPIAITSRITTYEQREQYLCNFLRNVLPSCDVKDIDNELKKSFTFNKHKSRVDKKKPQKSTFLTYRKSLLRGLNKFGKKTLRYSDMLQLNSLWLGYMHHMFGMENFNKLPKNSIDPHWENASQRLMKADYHGAKVTVTRTKCPSLLGIEGLIIQDTKSTFRLISKDDVIRMVPKDSCVFQIHLENGVKIEVFGKELCVRPAERSVKKFKNLHLPEL